MKNSFLLFCIVFVVNCRLNGSNSTKQYRKRLEKPSNVTWEITNFNITLKVSPNQKWPQNPDEYEVYTRHVNRNRKSKWRRRSCHTKPSNFNVQPSIYSDFVQPLGDYYCYLDYPVFLENNLRIKVRAKWDAIQINNQIINKTSQFFKAHNQLNYMDQGKYGAPLIEDIKQQSSKDAKIIKISVPSTKITCCLRNITYHLQIIPMQDYAKEAIFCNEDLFKNNQTSVIKIREKRIKQLTECEREEPHQQSIKLLKVEPGRRYCVQGSYEVTYKKRDETHPIVYQSLKSYQEFETAIDKKVLIVIIIGLILTAFVVYFAAFKSYCALWKKRRKRKISKEQNSFYDEQTKTLQTENHFSITTNHDDWIKDEPKADKIILLAKPDDIVEDNESVDQHEYQNVLMKHKEYFECTKQYQKQQDKDSSSDETDSQTSEELEKPGTDEITATKLNRQPSIEDSGISSSGDTLSSTRNSIKSKLMFLPSSEGYTCKDEVTTDQNGGLPERPGTTSRKSSTELYRETIPEMVTSQTGYTCKDDVMYTSSSSNEYIDKSVEQVFSKRLDCIEAKNSYC